MPPWLQASRYHLTVEPSRGRRDCSPADLTPASFGSNSTTNDGRIARAALNKLTRRPRRREINKVIGRSKRMSSCHSDLGRLMLDHHSAQTDRALTQAGWSAAGSSQMVTHACQDIDDDLRWCRGLCCRLPDPPQSRHQFRSHSRISADSALKSAAREKNRKDGSREAGSHAKCGAHWYVCHCGAIGAARGAGSGTDEAVELIMIQGKHTHPPELSRPVAETTHHLQSPSQYTETSAATSGNRIRT